MQLLRMIILYARFEKAMYNHGVRKNKAIASVNVRYNDEEQIQEDTLVDRKKPLLRKGFEEMGPTGLEPVTNRL